MESQEDIDYFIGFAWFLMFGLAMILIAYYYNYRTRFLRLEKEKQIIAFRAAVDAEEKQKEKIANNLHDEILPLLTVIGQHLEGRKNPDHKKTSEILDQVVSGIKSIALDLIPKTLLIYGLIKALQQHVRLLNGANEAVIELENNTGFESEIPLTKSDQVNIYRICLELLNNLHKHAGYSRLRIALENRAGQFVIELIHNGRGISNAEIAALSLSSPGLGLRSLQSRLMLLKGSIDYTAGPDAATITVSIPLTL